MTGSCPSILPPSLTMPLALLQEVSQETVNRDFLARWVAVIKVVPDVAIGVLLAPVSQPADFRQ